MSDNRARVLSQALSIDAWHDPFRVDGSTSGVHVEISFSEGRLGGDDAEFPFTFKLALKRALLTIKVERPLSLERRSVARSKPTADAERTMILAYREAAKANLAAKGRITPATIHLAISGEAKAEEEVTSEERVKVVQTIPAIVVSPKPVDRQSYSWDMVPGHSETLQGQPWDPVDEPRLRVSVDGTIPKIDPVISIVVSCALEDIEISDLVPKRSTLNDKVRNVIYNDISEKAAIQYLKRILVNADLETGKLDDRFSDLIVADLLALPE
ncbi:hypothetical protein [Sphingomonas beigongshangi]|uniref:hypothetical protein n=1 Tax=Sphingomonas beigongshangi TaxID=2782540 RepID=UPI00193B0AE5|nr:hypothetical protein [Sphingomonas beigongshangi]